MEVCKDGLIYYFTKDKKEVNDMFYERCRYVAEKKPLTQKDYEKTVFESKRVIYEKYYNCKNK